MREEAMNAPVNAKPLNDTLSVKREAPKPRSFSKPYWDATRDKKLLIQYCRKSGQYQFFPRATSLFTGRARDLEWREISGKGEIFTFTIARRTREPFQGHEPFFIATVTLDVGVNVLGNVVHCGVDEMRIGLKVKPFWAPLPNGTHLLMFEPDRAA
jgi:uncharacterized OB-fold protein